MALKVARRGEISPFLVMEMLRFANQRAAAGEDVFHLELGEPCAPTPRLVAAAAARFLAGGDVPGGGAMPGYTESLGLPLLRQRIAEYYAAREGMTVAAERIAVTTGSSGAFLLAFLSAFEHGDAVGLAVPGYPAYGHILSALGVRPVPIAVGPASRFQPSVELLKAVETPLDGLIIASPSNPAGTILEAGEFAAVAAYCESEGIRLISDEIYHGITFGAKPVSALTLWDEAIVINSFSKYFAMPGWRLGWMVAPAALLRSIESLAQNLFISAPSLAQHAAISVFDDLGEIDANVATYAKNREILLNGLAAAGFDRLAPSDGAFYLYADVSAMTNDSHEFCHRMLTETGVTTTPGMDFDPVSGHRFVRFSFAGPTESILAAVKRLKAWRDKGG